ncbi:MAG: hypothetical protein VXW22_12695, partial [Pseudomonadota bacterium]|nr:hypothetical protein [Pseudomonadota bacterium]
MRLAFIVGPAVALAFPGCVVTATAGLLYNGAKLAGKTVYYTGKGVYQVGKLTVRAADGVLDGTERMLGRMRRRTAQSQSAQRRHSKADARRCRHR